MNVFKLPCPRWCFSNILQISNKRFLFSKTTLGIDDYETMRDRYQTQKSQFETFKEKMREHAKKDCDKMIFTDDLKQFIHMCTKSEEELSLVEEMMKKFHNQNLSLRFGTYVFGPVIMRLYHYLNEPDWALKVFNSPELNGMFDQISTYIILMDLLFRNEKYQEIIDVYKTYLDKQFSYSQYPKSAMVLVFAACYKINTEESFEFAMDLWKKMNDSGLKPLRRVTIFATALALKQNNPNIAMELLTAIPNQNYILVRCLKALALSAIGRVEDALLIISSVVTIDTPNETKKIFPPDVVAEIEQAVEKSGSKELQFELERLKKQLTMQNFISNESLEEMILAPVVILQQINRPQSMLHNSFRGPKVEKIFQRPGLLDVI